MSICFPELSANAVWTEDACGAVSGSATVSGSDAVGGSAAVAIAGGAGESRL